MSRCLKTLRNIYYRSYGGYVTWNCSELSNRKLHCSSKRQFKMHLEHENMHAYNVMEFKSYINNSHNVIMDVVILSEEYNALMKETWSKKPPKEIFNAFSLLGAYCFNNNICISNKIFDSYIDDLTDNIKYASDEELKTLFHSLLKWPETESIRTRNFIEVWAALDDECLKRMNKWSFDEMLCFVNLFYMINITKFSEFSCKALNKMATKANQLTQSQLVQNMFFVSTTRKSPFDIHNIELHIEKKFSEFSIDELGILAMGFFKSRTPIRSRDLVENIIHKVMDNSKDIHEVSLAVLLKIIRYSLKINNNEIIEKMLDLLQHEVHRLSVMCNIQMALVGMNTLALHKECLEKIAESILKSISLARLKDLERITLTFGTFNFEPGTQDDFFEQVIKELRKPERASEIKDHGRSFACCVAYLGHLNYYPIDLMKKVLTPEFLHNTYGKQILGYGREVLAVHNTGKIFYPDENINFANEKTAILLGKKYTDYLPHENFSKQLNVTEKFILDVLKTLKTHRGGNDYVIGDHILTHHQRGDIILCNDKYGNPVEVKKHFRPERFGTLIHPPDDNLWIVLIIAGRNVIIKNTGTASGPFQAKMRELQTLGYHPALVLWSKYILLETEEEKINYLNNLIKESLNNKGAKIQFNKCVDVDIVNTKKNFNLS